MPAKQTKPAKPTKQAATRRPKSKSASRVANLTESDARGAWLGLQMHEHSLLIEQYTVAFGCGLILAGDKQDEKAIEIKIKMAVAEGEEVGGVVQEFQEALFISWKSGHLWKTVSNHLEYSSGPSEPIAIWAGLQRDDLARSAFSSAEGKLLEDILILACIPRDRKQLSNVSSAVEVLRNGLSSGSSPSSGGGCALPAFAMSLLIVVGLASVLT